MQKTYTQPQFTLVRTDGQDKVFFATSGTPSAPTTKATLGSMSSNNVTSW